MTDISNLDMVRDWIENAHDARFKAAHDDALSAAAIAQVYALLALGDALRDRAPVVVSNGPFTEHATSEVDVT